MIRKVLGGPVLGLACIAFAAAPGAKADDLPHPFGKPEGFKPGAKTMYAVWYEKDEWHIVTTSKDKGKDSGKVSFTGRISIEGDRVLGEFKKLEKSKKGKDADYILLFRDYKGFDFLFSTYGKSDDVQFKGGEKAVSIKFKLLIDGKEDPKSIFIGKKGLHPEKAEFTYPARPVK